MSGTNTGKRLAKNTVYMYIRMIVLTIVTLYTSRVVLQQLGVEDFGIYSVVGSVVAMFSSLRGLFASSTQRFINYQMGRGCYDTVKTIFNMSIAIQLIISLGLLFLAESVGIWFIESKMSVEPDRVFAAHWTLQLSLLSVIFSMITTPFDALIIAHEKMNFYAYVAIFEAILRLVIVFVLNYSPIDKLICYAALQLLITLIVFLINLCYCRYSFAECRFQKSWSRDVFFEMSSFAGWNFLGNTAFALTQNGLNMLLNTFVGVAANAAREIAYQVNAALVKALGAITIVINPYCTKTYASGQLDKTLNIIYLSSKIYMMIQIFIALPLCVYSEDVLSLWLGAVPKYANGFVKLVMLHTVIRSIHYPLNNLFISVGNLKRYQIAEVIILSIPLLFSYVFLKNGFEPFVVFWMMIVFEIINYFAIINIAHKDAYLPKKEYLRRVIVPCIVVLIVGILGFYVCSITQYLLYKGLLLIVSLIAISTCMFFIGLNEQEKSQLYTVMQQLLRKH